MIAIFKINWYNITQANESQTKFSFDYMATFRVIYGVDSKLPIFLA
jgi:hypothetical protein